MRCEVSMDIGFYVLLGIKGFLIAVGFLLGLVAFLALGSLIGRLIEKIGKAAKEEQK